MKILFWRTEFYGAMTDGGAASLLKGKVSGLEELGHKCCFVSSGPMDLKESTKFYEVPYNHFFRNTPEIPAIIYNYKSIKSVKNIINVEKPDFIHKHHHDFHIGSYYIKKKTGLPFILHMDGLEYWIKDKWGKLYFKKMLKEMEEIEVYGADAITVPSKNLKNQVVDFFNIDQEKVFVTPNCVNHKNFDFNISGNNIREKFNYQNNFVVGYTGTFGNWHGIDYLAQAIKPAVEKNDNIRFLLVGDGVLRPKLEKIIKENNLEKYVTITGMINYKYIPEYLAACDVVVSPCINNPDVPFFNSPVKNFEYMAMKKPTVVTDVGQQSEIYNDNENALLVPEKDPEAIANAIIELYNNKELRGKISENAYKDSLKKYTWKHNAEIILQAYEYAVRNR